MNEATVLETVLTQLKLLHATHPEVHTFCPFPDDVHTQKIAPVHRPPSDAMQMETGLGESLYPELRDALVKLSPFAQWREAYKDTDSDPDFMNRFGCYEIVGVDALLASAKIRSFLVYHPPHLHYPWHHHPAEELYMVIAGEAEFHMKGRRAETLTSGQTSFHHSNVPHALTSHDHPVMAYVVWRDDFDVAPVWIEGTSDTMAI